MSRYPRLHPDLLELREEHLEPAFVAAVRGGTEADLRSVLEPAVLEPAGRDAWAVRILARDWCERMHEEVRAITVWTAEHGLAPTRPNSMNRYGLVLDELGYEPAFAALTRDWLRPFGALLYPEVGGATLDDHHAFVVQYDVSGDVELGFHVDQSDVTLNLCLGGDFEGGELYFRGRRCALHLDTPSAPEEDFDYDHVPGVALLHAGKHRHGAHPITAGERCNLIVWCMSSRERAREETEGAACSAWCGAARPAPTAPTR